MLLLVCDQEAMDPFLADLPPTGQSLMNRYWPGSLVLALPAGNDAPESITANRGQIKVMQPECPLLQSLLSMMPEGVLAVGCAGRLDVPSACTAQDVYNTFGEDVDYVLPGDALVREAMAPTVVSVDSAGEIHLLRSGGIVLD